MGKKFSLAIFLASSMFFPHFLFCDQERCFYAVPVVVLTETLFVAWICSQEGVARLGTVDVNTDEFQPILEGRHCPLMPSFSVSKSAFCFVENGFLKYKSFRKRSCKTFDLPLYDVKFPTFIDDNHIIFSARSGDRCVKSGLFVLQIDREEIKAVSLSLSLQDGCVQDDYLFPLFLDNHLFFVQRTDLCDSLVCARYSYNCSYCSYDYFYHMQLCPGQRFLYIYLFEGMCNGSSGIISGVFQENQKLMRFFYTRERGLYDCMQIKSVYEGNVVVLNGKKYSGGRASGSTNKIFYDEVNQKLFLNKWN